MIILNRKPVIIQPGIEGVNATTGGIPSSVTFTRSSRAWTFGPTLELTEYLVNQPRFSWDPVTGQYRGLLIEPTRTNAWANPRWEGGATGTPGTLPTGASFSPSGSGTTRQIVGFGMEDGLPYVDVRYSGTAINTNAIQFQVGTGATSITAAVGQTWSITFFWRVVAGAFAPFTGPFLRWNERDGETALNTAQVSAPEPGSAPLREQRTTLVRTLTSSGLNNIAPALGMFRAVGIPADLTLRIGPIQVEQASNGSSLILPLVGSPAVTTRAAESAFYPAPDGTYDELALNSRVGVWREGVTVVGGAREVIPPSNNEVTLLRLYPVGTAAANPGWAVPTT
jgi:hypothetical protein